MQCSHNAQKLVICSRGKSPKMYIVFIYLFQPDRCVERVKSFPHKNKKDISVPQDYRGIKVMSYGTVLTRVIEQMEAEKSWNRQLHQECSERAGLHLAQKSTNKSQGDRYYCIYEGRAVLSILRPYYKEKEQLTYKGHGKKCRRKEKVNVRNVFECKLF